MAIDPRADDHVSLAGVGFDMNIGGFAKIGIVYDLVDQLDDYTVLLGNLFSLLLDLGLI